MTITTIYYLLGYRVHLSEYMQKMGFTKQSLRIEKPHDLSEDQLRDAVYEWFVMEHLDEFCRRGNFKVNGVEYTSRRITHDNVHDGEMMVGIDLDSFDCCGNNNMKDMSLKVLYQLQKQLENLEKEWGNILLGPASIQKVTNDIS